MSYTNTFIQVAEDCPVSAGEKPSVKGKRTPIHAIQYELLTRHPYTYTHETLIFELHVRRSGITAEELAVRKDEIWDELFQKGHPCLRASSLTKRYGWGAHYNDAGKIAIYGMETPEYQQFITDESVKLLTAMRSKRR